MKLYFPLLLLFLTVFKLSSQTDTTTSQTFVILKSGEKIPGNTIERVSDSKILLDDKTYRKRDIAFYRNNGTLYATIGDAMVTSFFQSVWESKGVNFFIIETGMGTATSPNVGRLYFSKDFNPPKKVSAKNFKNMMQDDPLADDYIQRANGARTVSNISWAFAGALLVAGVVQTFSGADNRVSEQTIGIIGSVAILTGIITNGVKKQELRKALKQYYGLIVE